LLSTLSLSLSLSSPAKKPKSNPKHINQEVNPDSFAHFEFPASIEFRPEDTPKKKRRGNLFLIFWRVLLKSHAQGEFRKRKKKVFHLNQRTSVIDRREKQNKL
jgi:hypothetical protein